MIFAVDRRSRCHCILQQKKRRLIKHLDSFFWLRVCVYVRSRFVFVSVLYFIAMIWNLLRDLFFFILLTIILVSILPIFCICTTSELSPLNKSIQYFQQNKQTRFLVS